MVKSLDKWYRTLNAVLGSRNDRKKFKVKRLLWGVSDWSEI